MLNVTPKVLIVGAEPVGLTMASELARHGSECRIIDQRAAPLPYCRAIGVTPRTLEVWGRYGRRRTFDRRGNLAARDALHHQSISRAGC
jgi:2-polyprenyl-6-methoxyphenol hydroxylase-like FAD-dependent oxidoreductase